MPKRFVLGVAVSATLALTSSCAPFSSTSAEKKKSYVKECVLPQDQSGTLSGKWPTLPIPIAFKAGDFDSAEMTDIIAAADSWNEFYQESLGLKIFDYGDKGNPNQTSVAKSTDVCRSGLIMNNQFSGQVVIYKSGKWPYSNHDAMALTTFCTVPGTPLPSMYMAIMEVNYEDFFVDGKKVPDLVSIIAHEFGHLMGLHHSCDTAGKAGFPGCSPSLPETYLSAVLYPSFAFYEDGTGEQRRSLNDNDQGRANCVYKDSVAKATWR